MAKKVKVQRVFQFVSPVAVTHVVAGSLQGTLYDDQPDWSHGGDEGTIVSGYFSVTYGQADTDAQMSYQIGIFRLKLGEAIPTLDNAGVSAVDDEALWITGHVNTSRQGYVVWSWVIKSKRSFEKNERLVIVSRSTASAACAHAVGAQLDYLFVQA